MAVADLVQYFSGPTHGFGADKQGVTFVTGVGFFGGRPDFARATIKTITGRSNILKHWPPLRGIALYFLFERQELPLSNEHILACCLLN
jgi:hypothetical protein